MLCKPLFKRLTEHYFFTLRLKLIGKGLKERCNQTLKEGLGGKKVCLQPSEYLELMKKNYIIEVLLVY
jgi:hypothetical protein